MFSAAPGRMVDVESRGGEFTAYMKSGPVNEDDQVTCLLSADADLLNSLTLTMPRDDTFETDAWGPVLDGVDLPLSLEERVRRGDIAARVDVLAGYNLDEGTEFMSLTPPLECNASHEHFDTWVASFLGKGEIAEAAAPLYQPELLARPLPACRDRPKFTPGKRPEPGAKISGEDAGFFNAAMRMAGDKAIRCPTNILVRASSGRKFVYDFKLTPNFSDNFGDTS